MFSQPPVPSKRGHLATGTITSDAPRTTLPFLTCAVEAGIAEVVGRPEPASVRSIADLRLRVAAFPSRRPRLPTSTNRA